MTRTARTARTARRQSFRAVASGIIGTLLLFGLSAACGTTEPAPKPCATEDAPGPCRWDADVQGNGTGQSFTVHPDGTVEYDAAP